MKKWEELYGVTKFARMDDKGYLVSSIADSRRIVKIGVEFSAEERNLGRWIIRE